MNARFDGTAFDGTTFDEMEIGGYRIDAVIDGEHTFNPARVFDGTTAEDWAAHEDLLDENGRLPMVIGGFLVRGHGRTALVDLGYGPGTVMGIPTGNMMNALHDLGVDPVDVTDVLFTHLHLDHIGWASIDGVPQFPKATFRCGAGDYEHFVVGHNDAFADERLGPCADRFETYDQSPPLPGITTLAAPGHTPGSTIIVVSEGTERAMMLGDVVHCPVQLLDDEWGALFDFDLEMARRTRTRVAAELEGDTSLVMAGAHFPGLRFGRLLRGEGRRQWVV